IRIIKSLCASSGGPLRLETWRYSSKHMTVYTITALQVPPPKQISACSKADLPLFEKWTTSFVHNRQSLLAKVHPSRKAGPPNSYQKAAFTRELCSLELHPVAIGAPASPRTSLANANRTTGQLDPRFEIKPMVTSESFW